MLIMSDINGNNRRVRTPEETAIRKEPQGESMVRMSDLPTREQKPVPVSMDKVITIHDLHNRATIVRKDILESRKLQAIYANRHQGKLVGPKTFADYVQNGHWKGRRCFIIGGGPSVRDCDLSLLTGELTIGINRAYELLSPSILFGVDGNMWAWAEQGKLGEESKKAFASYKGFKVWMALHKMFPPDFYLIDPDEDGGYRIGTTRRLAFKNNSGYGAINLAAALGANPIYLLGFDMQGDGKGSQQWWHNGYPENYGENIYKRYVEEISNFAPVLKEAVIEVINLSPRSALKCFPVGDYKQVVHEKPVIAPTAVQVMAKPDMVTAITPTGDRPLAFALCAHWMESQSQRPDQWIIIDDGKVPMTNIPAGADYIRREPQPNDPHHTLNLNIQTALPHVKGSKILIIEDDEYYAPDYVRTMAGYLGQYEVVGISMSKYYHIQSGGYARHANTIHASLAQTGFRGSYIGVVNALAGTPASDYLDIRIWRAALAECAGFLFTDDPKPLYLGIKGLPGRFGIGLGHDPKMYGNAIDRKSGVLKKWVPGDYRIYEAIRDGSLNDVNCNTWFPKITGIVVCHNTRDLMKRAYESIRKFHPDMPIIIVDGSDKNDPCAEYVRTLRSQNTTVMQPGYNIGHGRGMCLAIDMAKTPYALIFDSDIEMLESPVDEMLAMMEPDTFGIGYLEKTGFDGYEYGAHGHHKDQGWMPMLHPYFHLLNIAVYRRFHPYVHHGAPCYLTALDIYKRGLSDKIIKEFPELGHTSGKGWNWVGKPSRWIRHDVAGTRNERTKRGLGEIEGDWVLNRGLV